MKHLPTCSQQAVDSMQALHQLEAIPAGDMRVVFSPYRLCPLGAHVDHQGGPVLGRTVDTGTVLAYVPLREPRVRLYNEKIGSLDFPLGQPPDLKHWARYAQAATLALRQDHPLKYGIVGFVSGSLIGAGLSSSASVSLAYFLALAQVNNLDLTREDLIRLAYRLEHDLLGLQIGILDPATIVNGQRDALLYINTLSQAVTPIPDPPAAKDWAWLLAYSGLSRELTHSGFNQRVAECHEAAAQLRAGAKRLSDVPIEVFIEGEHNLPAPLRRRAAHYFSEVSRVQRGKSAWAAGDAPNFGALMNASCTSSIQQYGSGNPVIIDLHRILVQAPGIFGGRFSGGGYGGCVIGLVLRDAAEAATAYINREFARQHPQLAHRAGVFLVETGDSLRFWEGV